MQANEGAITSPKMEIGTEFLDIPRNMQKY
jgi:hypothetical protein